MKAWRFLLMLACCLPALRAQSADAGRLRLSQPAVRAQLVAVVKGQLAAFRQLDYRRPREDRERSLSPSGLTL